MARVGVRLLRDPHIPVHDALDADGSLTRVHYERLGALVFLGGRHVTTCDSWIDTGAYLTIIPKRFWDVDYLRGQIAWLAPPPGQRFPASLGTAGGAYRYRLGRVRITVMDPASRQRISGPVLAQFVEDVPPLPPVRAILLGLRHGLLDGRRLVVEPGRHAYLEDRSP